MRWSLTLSCKETSGLPGVEWPLAGNKWPPRESIVSGYSSVWFRALRLGRRGQRFESSYPDMKREGLWQAPGCVDVKAFPCSEHFVGKNGCSRGNRNAGVGWGILPLLSSTCKSARI